MFKVDEYLYLLKDYPKLYNRQAAVQQQQQDLKSLVSAFPIAELDGETLRLKDGIVESWINNGYFDTEKLVKEKKIVLDEVPISTRWHKHAVDDYYGYVFQGQVRDQRPCGFVRWMRYGKDILKLKGK